MRRVKEVSGVLLVILCMWGGVSKAQSVSNVRANIDPTNVNQVIITYDLTPSALNQTFRIELKSSHDNYALPLTMVSGDVGENITAGNGKRIFWRAREELGLFNGNISFEIVSTLTSSPLRMTSPRLGETFDPGTGMVIEWEGGFSHSNMQLELFKSNLFNRKIATTPNTKRYSWEVPADLQQGSDYTIKLYDMSAPADAVMSNNFTINVSAIATQTKPKEEKVKKEKKGGGKAGLIIGGLALAGGAAYFLLAGGEEDAPQQQQQQQFDDSPNFPAPPGTPDGSTIQRRGRALISFNIGF